MPVHGGFIALLHISSPLLHDLINNLFWRRRRRTTRSGALQCSHLRRCRGPTSRRPAARAARRRRRPVRPARPCRRRRSCLAGRLLLGAVECAGGGPAGRAELVKLSRAAQCSSDARRGRDAAARARRCERLYRAAARGGAARDTSGGRCWPVWVTIFGYDRE